jgi:hypothetical protein
MKTLIAAGAVAVLLLLAEPRAGAQVVVTAVPGGTSVYTETPYVSYQFYPYNDRYPYSYWAAIPFPARGYVGYGGNDFPYYGRPYGNPSDPWTWPYLSAAYQDTLSARFYYPPLR